MYIDTRRRIWGEIMSRILILLFVLFSASVFAGYEGTNPILTQQQLMQSPKKYLIVDVRSPSEFKAGYVKHAINIPHHAITDNLAKLTSDKPIVVYCKSGYRAWKAEQAMMKNGITNIFHLDGDMNGWKQNKLSLTK